MISRELGLGQGPASRLASTGLVDSLPALRRLAARMPPPVLPDALAVSLGVYTEFDEQGHERDGGWRWATGWKSGMDDGALALSAAGWWRAGRTPSCLLAVTTGGFTVGAWDVEDIADVGEGGRLRFALGAARPDLLETRVTVRPGPPSRWLQKT
jgi:hypothetical protein